LLLELIYSQGGLKQRTSTKERRGKEKVKNHCYKRMRAKYWS